jgi:hypothetical protein
MPLEPEPLLASDRTWPEADARNRPHTDRELAFHATQQAASARDEFQSNFIAKNATDSANIVGCLERVKGIDSGSPPL